MNPLEALHLQLRLEGRQIVRGNRLRQVELVPGEEMPLMLLARLADERVVPYYDESLPAPLQREVEKRSLALPFTDLNPLLDFLTTEQISFTLGHYKTSIFPASSADRTDLGVRCHSTLNPSVQAFGFGDFAENVYCIESEGKVVSACASIRENERCGEAWVYTDPEHRRHGYAQQVAAAWARSLLKAGRVPFYSHRMDNLASANLAKQLGLEFVFEEIVISNPS